MKTTKADFISLMVADFGKDFWLRHNLYVCDCGAKDCVGWKAVPFGARADQFSKPVVRFQPEDFLDGLTRATPNYREEQGLKAKNPERKSVLLEADALINGDRAKDYGDVRTNFTNWRDMCRGTGRPNLKHITAEDLATAMVCLKVCRDSTTAKRDNPVDGAAYFEILDRVRGL